MAVNFKKVRFSCYALGKIMGMDRDEKLSKADLYTLKKLEEQIEPYTDEELSIRDFLRRQKKVSESSLSKTCITYLTEEVFVYHTYGQRIRPGGESLNESVTRIMKGTLCEESAIQMVADYDGINYKKNKRKYRNRWVTGIPDINYKKRLGDRKVIDIKSSWDMYSFIKNLPQKISTAYKCQTQGYIALTNADIGEVCHVLVSAPDELIEKQVAKLKYKNVFATKAELEEAEYLTRKSMRFDDIPEDRRIIRFPVSRDTEFQESMFARVDECREWLVQYQQKHEDYFKNR